MIGLPSINHRIISPHELRGATIKPGPQAAGLVAAWQPNVFPGGNVLYDRAGVKHGTIVGATLAADATEGHVLQYSGTAQWVNCASTTLGTADHTITLWVKGTTDGGVSIGGENPAGGVSPALQFGYMGAGKIRYWIRDAGDYDSVYSNQVVLDGTWHFCAVSADISGLAYVYTDVDFGSPASVDISALGGTGGATLWSIGALGRSGGNVYPFTGEIGEVRIYNRALTASEIGAIYADPLGLWQPTLQIPMDDDYAVGHPALRRHGALPDSMIYHRNAYTRWG